jgi:predicted DNA-binding transcriptional regulator AlpA
MNLTDLTRRVAALEKIIQAPKQARRRLKKREVAEREGASMRTIDRRVARGSLPPPELIDGRHYWWSDVLDAHDASLLQKAKGR